MCDFGKSGGGSKIANLTLTPSVKINILSICEIDFRGGDLDHARDTVLIWLIFASSYFEIYPQMTKLQVRHVLLFARIIQHDTIIIE